MPSAAYLGRSQFSCKPKAIANLFDIAEVQPKMDEVKDSASRIFVQAETHKELVLVWVRRSQKWKKFSAMQN